MKAGSARRTREVARWWAWCVALVSALQGLAGSARGAESTPVSGPSIPGLVLSTNLVFIKAGSFTRAHQQVVTLTRDYWMSKYEVTQGEFLALMGRNPSHFTGEPRRPVEKVSFLEAHSYCVQLTRRERESARLTADYEYRLPTEAEWEWACRAGSTNRFSFGDDEAAAVDHAWTEENSEAGTHPVGLKQPNAWGLYDMHGNVWEWCRDWFAEFPTGPQTDPSGPESGKFKVFRGGSWNHQAKFARCGNRFVMAPANGIFFVGFRVVLAPVFAPARAAAGG